MQDLTTNLLQFTIIQSQEETDRIIKNIKNNNIKSLKINKNILLDEDIVKIKNFIYNYPILNNEIIKIINELDN